jgi:hypothetical protein
MKFNKMQTHSLNLNTNKNKSFNVIAKYYYNSSYPNINTLITNLTRRLYILLAYNINDEILDKLADIVNGPFEIYFFALPINRHVNNYDNDKSKTGLEEEIKMMSNHGCYNCSSGYTYLYISPTTNHKKMVITKIPEMLGLLTHEIGHLVGWDFSTLEHKNGAYHYNLKYLSKEQDNKLKNICVDGGQEFYFWEVFDNTNATIVHAICNSIELGQMLDYNYNESFNLFTEMYKVELLYSIYHSAKILFWFGFSSFSDFFSKCKNKIKYFQRARLFEYSVARSFMLLKYGEIFNDYVIYDDVNKRSTFKIETTNIDRITDMIINLMCNTDLDNNGCELRDNYERIFNSFVDYVNRKNNLNMEYFCIDYQLTVNIQKGGNNNYYYKYHKYKTKYIMLKEHIDSCFLDKVPERSLLTKQNI